jgi:hypothetical protein
MKRILLILAVSLFLVTGCGKKNDAGLTEDGNGYLSAEPYKGLYELHPSENPIFLQISENSIFFLIDSQGTEIMRGIAEMDRNSVRFIIPDNDGHKQLTGIFLRSDYDLDIWKGYWKNNVKFLKKLK